MLTIEGLSLIPAVHAGAGKLLSRKGGRGSEGGDGGLASEGCSAHPGLGHAAGQTHHGRRGRGRRHRGPGAEVAL